MRVVAGVVAERPLDADVVLRDSALEHDLRVAGTSRSTVLHITSSTASPRRKPATISSSMWAGRAPRRVRGHRVEPQRDGNRDLAVLGRQQVGATVLVHLPVHERRARSITCMRYMPTLRVPLTGSRVITAGSVMNGAGSPGQQVWIGSRVMSTSSPVSTISWHTPLETIFGRESAIDLSFIRPCTFSRRPSGGCISSTSASFAATSSSCSTPNARPSAARCRTG